MPRELMPRPLNPAPSTSTSDDVFSRASSRELNSLDDDACARQSLTDTARRSARLSSPLAATDDATRRSDDAQRLIATGRRDTFPRHAGAISTTSGPFARPPVSQRALLP